MVTSPCRLHFLSPFPMFPLLLSFPPFPPTMERIWKITCVTLHVICCLLLPEFLYLTPSPCLCFFLSYFSFFFSLSLCVYIWSPLQHLQHVCLWCVLGEIHALYCFGELHVGAWGENYIPPPPIFFIKCFFSLFQTLFIFY